MGATAAVHPTDQTLRSFSLGKLDDAKSESVSKHLETCSDCQRRVAEMSSDSFLGRLQDAAVPPASPASAPVVSSPDVMSMVDTHHGQAPSPQSDTLPQGLADHPDYEVIRELGQGGMGTVYLAKNRLMGRYEVLKVVSSHLIKRPGVLDRFLGEIRNAARLHHTNVVTAHSASRLGESIVFGMEYVEGLDLAKLVKANGPLPVANACNYVYQAALGLQHAHEHGMVHRDIKPSNLMLARVGKRAVIKVLDFGLAKIQSEGPVDGGLTHEGQMLGTPDYIAPEQIRNARGSDIRADIYSLGCTLYYLLAGRPPFQATSLYDLLQAHHSMEATPLNLARPEVPMELAALVAKMMAKDVERRLQEPKDVAQALVPFFKTVPWPTGSGADLSRGSSRAATTPMVEPVPTPPATLRSKAPRVGRGESKTGANAVVWEGLIAIKEDEPLIKPTRSAAPEPRDVLPEVSGRRQPWKSWRLAAAASVFGLAVLLGIITYIKTNNSEIKAELGKGKAADKIGDGDVGVELNPTVARETQTRVKAVTSRFDEGDDEGWHTINEDSTENATEFMKVGTDHGNHYLVARDHSNGKYYGWLAPEKYNGDHSDKFGRFLKFDTKTNGNGSGWSGTVPCIRLRGRGKVIFVDQKTVGRPIKNRWRTCRIKLDSSGGWKMLADGGQTVIAIDSDIKYVLSNLKDLWINGNMETTTTLAASTMWNSALNWSSESQDGGTRSSPRDLELGANAAVQHLWRREIAKVISSDVMRAIG